MRYAIALIVAILLAACQPGHPERADGYRGGHGHYHVH